MLLLGQGGMRPSRDLGEPAAPEVIRQTHLLDSADDRALLLKDDRDVERSVVIGPERLILLTTWDYLRQVEETRKMQSADAVMAAVMESGRNPPRRDLWSGHDPDVKDAVKDILDRSWSCKPG